MKKISLTLTIVAIFTFHSGFAQSQIDNSKIDILLIRGEYKKVIDTCKLILSADTLNSEIYYKMGLAYQNLLSDDKSFDCFLRAATISPENSSYNYMVAKSYYNKGKTNLAKPILLNLCDIDSMNWIYSYYLGSIYMQEGKYDESIKVYNRFYQQDSANYIYIDKIGLAYLKKGEFSIAIDLFNRSLELNKKNVTALKNLAYLYTLTYRADTAIQLLTGGMEIDPSDMDLYARRAALNYSINYNKRALNDYLKILSSGDSSVLYLKRAGIGYTNNLQPKEAIEYLLKAYKKDSADYEISSYLGQNYAKIKDFKKSAYYYKHIIKTLNPVIQQLSLNYFLLAEVLKSDGLYNEAITNYLHGQQIRPDPAITMIIANLYDEKLNDIPKAIYYYELFLDNQKNYKSRFKSDYIESIKKRLDLLKIKTSQ